MIHKANWSSWILDFVSIPAAKCIFVITITLYSKLQTRCLLTLSPGSTSLASVGTQSALPRFWYILLNFPIWSPCGYQVVTNWSSNGPHVGMMLSLSGNRVVTMVPVAPRAPFSKSGCCLINPSSRTGQLYEFLSLTIYNLKISTFCFRYGRPAAMCSFCEQKKGSLEQNWVWDQFLLYYMAFWQDCGLKIHITSTDSCISYKGSNDTPLILWKTLL